MVRILAADGMEAAAVSKLEELGFEVEQKFYEPEALAEKVKEIDVLCVRSATKVRQPIIDAAKEAGQLKLVIRGGVGVDNIDVKYAEENGIAVRNTPKASSASVAELTLMHMLMMARFGQAAAVTMTNGEWNKKKYEGIELGGKTLGLVGMGRIAREIAMRAHAIGMKIIYTDILGEMKDLPEYTFMSMEDVLKNADFISLHIPKPADKPCLIGAAEIATMKDGVFLVNAARGGLIDENDLCDALDSGKVTAAGLDVFAEEPTTNERVLKHNAISKTPHIGAATKEAQERIGEEIVSIISEFFAK